jgi:predicted ATPase
MKDRLIELGVRNFRSLREVALQLGPLNVLVGPNGAGKSNVLEVFRFLADVIRTDLEPALDVRGGFDELAFWGGDEAAASFEINLKATWTARSRPDRPDRYSLLVEGRGREGAEEPLGRREIFEFTIPGGHERRITVKGRHVTVEDISRDAKTAQEYRFGIQRLSSGLSTLPRLDDEQGRDEVAVFAQRLASFRVFDVDVRMAPRPAKVPLKTMFLEDDASNLAAFLYALRQHHAELFDQLVEDAIEVLPQLEGIDFEFPSGAGREVIVVLRERGLRRKTQLADASYGTIRLLGLLALLYDPEPPALTCVEEVDHGLHPQALELLVERLREASERTQFLIATHSPAFADRLKPEELVVCERRDDGSSAIPAITEAKVKEIVDTSDGLPLGRLWFSGALGGSL